eukprot:scaffold65663_cov69-Phaeocystis_antarctica.AAC.3
MVSSRPHSRRAPTCKFRLFQVRRARLVSVYWERRWTVGAPAIEAGGEMASLRKWTPRAAYLPHPEGVSRPFSNPQRSASSAALR